jgi:transposase-like protein
MEEITRRTRRIFTPEQKYEILKDIKTYPTIKEGLAKYNLGPSVYRRWNRQLVLGINSSLRNGRPPKDAALKRLEAENRKLKEIILNQSAVIADIKKEMSLD